MEKKLSSKQVDRNSCFKIAYKIHILEHGVPYLEKRDVKTLTFQHMTQHDNNIHIQPMLVSLKMYR